MTFTCVTCGHFYSHGFFLMQLGVEKAKPCLADGLWMETTISGHRVSLLDAKVRRSCDMCATLFPCCRYQSVFALLKRLKSHWIPQVVQDSRDPAKPLLRVSKDKLSMMKAESQLEGSSRVCNLDFFLSESLAQAQNIQLNAQLNFTRSP